MGGLTLVAVLIALFTRKKSSPSSHYFDEERASQGRAFTPLASQELSKHQQSYSIDNTTDFSGNLAGDYLFMPHELVIGYKIFHYSLSYNLLTDDICLLISI